jgi:hypothetical protein
MAALRERLEPFEVLKHSLDSCLVNKDLYHVHYLLARLSSRLNDSRRSYCGGPRVYGNAERRSGWKRANVASQSWGLVFFGVLQWSALSRNKCKDDRNLLTKALGIVADCLEFLYGYMRIFGEKYDIPVIVSHGRRLGSAVWVQLYNEKATNAWA